jgi:hypothetical protein
MAVEFMWTPPGESAQTALTTELNALANDTLSALSAEIPNETDLYEYIAYELNLASLDPAAGGYVEIWHFASLDGTTYPQVDKTEAHNLVATIVLDADSTAQIHVVTRDVNGQLLRIPPLDFKAAVLNKAGVAFGATTNTLKYRRYNLQGV